ncbi:glycosyltransferase family 2 protein [Photobacterium leiognathi]|uniref:glycosyltransferase family 2 protein n=1 Tax=Photobacterium leiognathi TaxID=553611 RepID=UPI0029828499|nr:glycosyltransferase [Photobacterium leiognathi]
MFDKIKIIISSILYPSTNIKIDLKDENNESKVSAIYRVKNGESTIEKAILSVVDLVEEIIFVDNGSTDNTINIVNELSNKYNIKIFEYKKDLCFAGKGYKERLKENPSGSLADYYTYSFSKGKSDYLMKCDANYIFTKTGLNIIKKELKKKPDVICYPGVECFGNKHVLEPFIFKRNSGWKFIDDELWEKVVFPENLKWKKIFTALFIHVKRYNYIKYTNKKKKGVEALYDSKNS